MKKFLSLFLSFLLVLVMFPAFSEVRWQDSVSPRSDIAEASVLLKIEESTTLLVGSDIPAGVYRVTHGFINETELFPVFYGLSVFDGIVEKNRMFLNTEQNANTVFQVRNGETLMIVFSDTDVVYLSSVDDFLLTLADGSSEVEE